MNYHLLVDDKFIDRFIETAEEVAPGNNTYLFTFSGRAKYIKSDLGTSTPLGSDSLNRVMESITSSDRVFVHWFSDELMPHIRRLQPNVPLYLFFWGGDFLEQSIRQIKFNLEPVTFRILEKIDRYAMFHRSLNPISYISQIKMFLTVTKRWAHYREQAVKVRKEFLERLNYFCHWNEEDLDKVKEEYSTHATFRPFFYDIGFSKFPDEVVSHSAAQTKVIWLGNSATFPNNHMDALLQLQKFKNQNISIVAPLSYGNKQYGDIVSKKAGRMFGDKFSDLRTFIPLSQYLDLVKDVDVVVMNHNRTQAAANSFAFLRMGKKLFLRKESTIYTMAVKEGMKVFPANDIHKLDFEDFTRPLSPAEQEDNRKKINTLFSETNRYEYMKKLLT